MFIVIFSNSVVVTPTSLQLYNIHMDGKWMMGGCQ